MPVLSDVLRFLLLTLAVSPLASSDADAGETVDLATCLTASEGDCVARLFDGSVLTGVYAWFEESGFADPLNVVSINDGLLRISGEALGALITRQTYRNYVVLVEYRWGDETFPPRARRARDAGLFVHSDGVEGGFDGKWMGGIQSQILEGGNGDLILLPGRDSAGAVLPQSITTTVEQLPCTQDNWGCRGGFRWLSGGTATTFEGNLSAVHWRDWDPDWQDTLGYRGEVVLENPAGEWNQMQIVAAGDQLTVYFNGERVNDASDVQPQSGRIQLESEFAEYFVRRWEVWPLDAAPLPSMPGDAAPISTPVAEPEPEDTDGDGLIDVIETAWPPISQWVDTDGDGREDSVERDVLLSLLAARTESGDVTQGTDTDGDGVPDSQDLDSDNDTILDVIEAGGADRDGDGRLDVGELWSDTVPDRDLDGIPDFQDIASETAAGFDILAHPDAAELDRDADGRVDDSSDADGNGIADVIDIDTAGPDTPVDEPTADTPVEMPSVAQDDDSGAMTSSGGGGAVGADVIGLWVFSFAGFIRTACRGRHCVG